MILEETFRWFGPKDPVPLKHIRQAGATGIVSSLHHIPVGEVWSVEEIRHHHALIDKAGLGWSVIESLPVHEEIKTRSGKYKQWIDNYRQSLRNLGQTGPKIVTYNFMPVLDWVRTDLDYELPDGARTVRYEPVKFVAFEVFIFKRPGAEKDYPRELVAKAEEYFRTLKPEEAKLLERNIVDNFPGTAKGTTMQQVRDRLLTFAGIDRAKLKEHLKLFLEDVVPVAEENGIRLVIHPDDPPFSVLGLPRIFSNAEDVNDLRSMVESPANGICYCTGSFSARRDNDLPQLFQLSSDRVGFLHLRSTATDDEGNIVEANHLEGNVDMYAIVKAALKEAKRRKDAGQPDWRIPFRPDHGLVMLDDLEKPPLPTPGYSAIGRLRGLAELRGLELGIARTLFPDLVEAAKRS